MAPNSVPPQLPPSVEEAYRRKCVELKRRNHQVEEANDAARVRIARIKRQVEKLRIERAFLLEQLTKRTSTNVEDSEGSPSPPPTGQDFDFNPINKDSTALLSDADANVRKPKEKPMRTKRPHGKANATADAASEAAGDNMETEPGNAKDEDLPDAAPVDAPDHPAEDAEANDETLALLSTENPPDGRDVEKDGELPGENSEPVIGGFNVYALLRRKELEKADKPDIDIRATILAEWKDLPAQKRTEFSSKFTELGSSSGVLDADWTPPAVPEKIVTKPKDTPTPQPPKDEDVEMEDGDGDKSEAPADKEQD